MRKIILLLTTVFALTSCDPSANKSAEDPIMELPQNTFRVDAEGGLLEIQLYTNQEYHFEIIEEWISEVSFVSDDMIKTHKLKVQPNTVQEERSGTVTVCTDLQCIPIIIYQKGAEENGSGGGEEPGNQGGEDDIYPEGLTGPVTSAWTAKSFAHRSLGIRVTADWCGACPYLASSFEAARELMPDKYEVVSLHASGGLSFAGTNYITYSYNITGYPTGIVDGRAKIPNYTSSSLVANIIKYVVEETEASYPTTSAIAMNSSLNGSDLSVDLSLYLKKADDYKVTVLLLEDNIIGYQNGGGSNYDHDHVAILSLSSYTGDEVSTESDNMIWSKTYTATVPQGADHDNLKLLVFVQKPYGTQQRVESTYYGEYDDFIDYTYYIDNCRVVKIGTYAGLELKD
jgi:hypothetical protein